MHVCDYFPHFTELRKETKKCKSIVPLNNWAQNFTQTYVRVCSVECKSRFIQNKVSVPAPNQYGAQVYALHRLHNGIEKSFSSAINAVVVVIIALLIVLSVFSFCSLCLPLCIVFCFIFLTVLVASLFSGLLLPHIYMHTLSVCVLRADERSHTKRTTDFQHERVSESETVYLCECVILIQLSRIYVNDFRTKLYQHNL